MSKFHWNTRIIKYDNLEPDIDGDYYHAIHEVHYEDGKIIGWTADAMDVGGSGLEAIKKYYDLIGKAFEKPVLSMRELNKMLEVQE